jgi:ribosomal-protein-serine acetyltransferase
MLSLTVNETILLRTYLEDDAAEHFLLVETNRKHLRPWLRWIDAHKKEAHSLDYIRFTHSQQKMQQALMLGIFEEGKLIGELVLHQWDQDLKKAEIGYWIDETHQRKGVAKSCLVRFIRYLFEQLGLNKLEARFVPANTRSAKLAAGLGFQVEGVLRDSLLHNGIFQDLVVTGLLKKEWLIQTQHNT